MERFSDVRLHCKQILHFVQDDNGMSFPKDGI